MIFVLEFFFQLCASGIELQSEMLTLDSLILGSTIDLTVQTQSSEATVEPGISTVPVDIGASLSSQG